MVQYSALVSLFGMWAQIPLLPITKTYFEGSIIHFNGFHPYNNPNISETFSYFHNVAVQWGGGILPSLQVGIWDRHLNLKIPINSEYPIWDVCNLMFFRVRTYLLIEIFMKVLPWTYNSSCECLTLLYIQPQSF